jgi:hypothetical protein
MVPPPTSFFVFTSARSGSMPVVSQSIISPMVPVGASTDAWAFRYPCSSPRATASSHDCFAAVSRPSGTSSASMSSAAARCLRMTRSMASRFGANPANGPMTSEIRALAR